MQKWIFLPAFALLAACESTSNPTQTSAGGATLIQIQNGRNCWDNRCMNLNLSRRSVQLAGRNAAGIPGNIDVSDGYVTAAEFRQIFEAGNRAYSIGVGRN